MDSSPSIQFGQIKVEVHLPLYCLPLNRCQFNSPRSFIKHLTVKQLLALVFCVVGTAQKEHHEENEESCILQLSFLEP